MGKAKILNLIYVIGMIVTLVATTIGVITNNLENSIAKYLLIIGVLPIIIVRGVTLYYEKNPASRLPFIMMVSSLFLIGAIVALFTYRKYWVLLIFISAILDLYASFRASRNS